MIYVIFDAKTTRLFYKKNGDECFKSPEAAERYVTRHLDHEKYGVADYVTYRDSIERKVERTNLMSGQKYMESINTPNYMSPASEAYWSM